MLKSSQQLAYEGSVPNNALESRNWVQLDLDTLSAGPGQFNGDLNLTGGTSTAVGAIRRLGPGSTYAIVNPVSGTFQAAETVTGNVSGNTANVVAIDTMPDPSEFRSGRRGSVQR